ncbi:hypothetical protein OPQ81_003341 [Rhizoctonia solani]|nr:hypothetical protein OPQ81_003341 [Rhizoctonia solani]
MSLHIQPPRIHHPPPPLSNPHPSLTHVPSEDEEEDEDQLPTGDQPSQQRTVRKRSSKACDNCRKAKCKCEKSPDNPACRNCVLLGQECTFLGPSRKRALLGTLIASPDPRAQSLIADLITDPLAQHIIARVDESPFGSRGKDSSDARDPKARTHINTARTAILNGQVGFDVPPRDWQDELGARILHSSHSQPPSRHVPTPPARSPSDAQRRRLSSSGSVSPAQPRHTHLPPDESDGEPDPLTDALGQLSLNEHHQLRYHGKASGLHILAQAPAYRRDRVRMDDDGIWKFPASRVWPPVAEERDSDTDGRVDNITGANEDFETLEKRVATNILPPREQQEKLLNLYFAYVHPVLPVIHQEVFWRDWKASADPSAPPSSRIPTLLLLSIYAVAARYDASRRPPRAGTMWAAGDNYLEAAKVLLNRSYASSKASTCQALLLLSYREIGIGAMAQAWLYVGMSVRMAQDLGLHRSIDKWQAAGANTFSAAEKQTRRCIWFGCVVMDKYVSTYIGRPLAVFERDYDTRWPDQDTEEADQDWVDMAKDDTKGSYEPVPGRVLPCFAAASKLSAILSRIVEALYSIRPVPGASKSNERAALEEELEKWLLNLPVYLRYDITRGVTEGSGKIPPPHVLTLHMMYWCSVLLLHRPSIRFNKPPPTHRFASPEGSTTSDRSTSTTSTRAIGLCKLAANHITKIVSTYGEHFSLGRGPAFLSYYVFSASIMHVTLLMMNPEDVQAQMGLQECMTALESMNTTWPSAGRAFELLNESKMNIQEHYLESLRHSPWRHKRKTPEEQEDGTEHERQRSASRDGIQLAPMREIRPMVNLRTQSRDGIISHPSPTNPPSSHSPVPPIMHHARSSVRHVQPNSGQTQNYAPVPPSGYPPQHQPAQSVEPMFADPGYARWGGDIPPYNHASTDGGQGYFGNTGNSWEGHMQPQPQQPHGQGWTTSATRFSTERPSPSSAGNPGGYWQDYPSTTFGNDMSSSLYGIMPQVPGAVGMQSIFQDGATGVYQNPDGPGGISPSYPVYSRLS